MLGNELLLQLHRCRRVVAELHRELTLTLSSSSELGREAEHRVQTAVGIEGEVLRANLSIRDNGVALVEQTDNVTLELVGCGDGSLHQGLEDLGLGGKEGLAEGLLGSVTERHFG